MKRLTNLIPLLCALLAVSCDNHVTDAKSLHRARDRADDILLCTPDYSGKTSSYALDRPLYLKKDTSIPWRPGETVDAPGFEIAKSDFKPD